MHNIANKARMAQVLGRMARQFPQEYNFYPRTWVLPAEISSFSSIFDEKGKSNDVFIIKPDAGAKGRGIFLTSSLEQVKQSMQKEISVAQRYIRHPLLIDGLKFDIRLYVLITSVAPPRLGLGSSLGLGIGSACSHATNLHPKPRLPTLPLLVRIYLFHDGLIRLCTEPYVDPYTTGTKQNMNDLQAHLTNYAINKDSDNFTQAEDETGAEVSSPEPNSDYNCKPITLIGGEQADSEVVYGLDGGALWRR